MFNLLYYVPMNVVGRFVWKKHMDTAMGEVTKKRLAGKSLVLMSGGTVIAVIVFGLLLRCLGGNLTYVENFVDRYKNGNIECY